MPKNLRLDAYCGRRACTSPQPSLAEQLHRLVTEERPGACLGCGFENGCSLHGCAVLRKISRIVARAEGGAEDDA